MSFPQRRGNDRQDQVRVNNRIRVREVRVISGDGKMLGVMNTQDAIALARSQGVDLVEISPNANPPVCKLVDIGKYRYDAAKREKEAKKNQHTNKLKEIQIRPMISERDFQVKMERAVGFFCNDMKVRLVLRFRGREMNHKEFGFEMVQNFIKAVSPFASADGEPKLQGKSINVMLTPLPRSRRAKNPKGEVSLEQLEKAELAEQQEMEKLDAAETSEEEVAPVAPAPKVDKKQGKSSFGVALLDEINLEISPKRR